MHYRPDVHFDSSYRIGILISDDTSLIDIANALARGCGLAGQLKQCADCSRPLRVHLLSNRAGFVSRGNGSIPAWVEAMDAMAVHAFNVILVTSQASSGKTGTLSKMRAWLAEAGPEVQIIELAAASEQPYVERPTAKAAHPVVRRDTRPLDDRINASIRWLDEHYSDHVSISEIAQRALMSERHFLRRFKAEVGQTPHQYLSLIRLANARQLLDSTDLPIDKIARHCGLFNGDHLRKQFLKHFRISPTEYRATRRPTAPLLSDPFDLSAERTPMASALSLPGLKAEACRAPGQVGIAAEYVHAD